MPPAVDTAHFAIATLLLPAEDLRVVLWASQPQARPAGSATPLGRTLITELGEVRFCDLAGTPRPLGAPPAVVLSEVLRDVELIIASGSIANEQGWGAHGNAHRLLDNAQRLLGNVLRASSDNTGGASSPPVRRPWAGSPDNADDGDSAPRAPFTGSVEHLMGLLGGRLSAIGAIEDTAQPSFALLRALVEARGSADPLALKEYRNAFKLGPLSPVAQIRRQLVQALMPRLGIQDLYALEGAFLLLQGDHMTCKIHLGSATVLRSPHDEPVQVNVSRRVMAEVRALWLPFDGDPVLTDILAKAVCLRDIV